MDRSASRQNFDFSIYAIADLRVDPAARRATRGERILSLRPKEFDLLVQLARHAGRTLSSTALRHILWPGEATPPRRLVVHIHNLRRALDDGAGDTLLHTDGRSGYVLAESPPGRVRRVRRATAGR